MSLAHRTIDSPVGRLRLAASRVGVVAIMWEVDRPGRVMLDAGREGGDRGLLEETEQQLRQYFAGSRREFTLPLDLRGTEFQKRVWASLQRIPFGETRTYGEIATELGDANATRAVGAANGRNPVSVVVPCRRVIGASGRLTGFAGGMAAKAYLLELEQQGRRLF